eukprot:Tbor_TRINITY_DN5754_c1_g1::TRINITY_DN5754_c1_g1_i5::g.20823::m.20823
MVCDNFKPNVFKADICMVCQRPKSEHPLPPEDVKAVKNKVACKEFVPNPFKNDICKICQLGKKLHESVNVSSVVITKKEQTYNPESVCDSFEAHAFKPDICMTCRLPRALHKGVAAVPVSKTISPKVASTPIEKKPELSTKVIQKKPEVPNKPDVSAQQLKNEIEHTKVTQKPSQEVHIPTEKGVACDKFQPNPFKPVLCKECRLHKSLHAASALHEEAGNGSLSTESKSVSKPVTPTQSVVTKKPPPRQVVQSDSDSDKEEKAICPPKKVDTKQVVDKVDVKPPQKTEVADLEPVAPATNEKSRICEDSSDDDTNRAPVQAPRKIPVKKPPAKKKTYSDEDSGEEICTTSNKMKETKNSESLTLKKKVFGESDDDMEEAIIKVDHHATSKEVGAPKPKTNFNPVSSSDHHERFRQNITGTVGAMKKGDSSGFGDEDDLSAPVVKKTVLVD